MNEPAAEPRFYAEAAEAEEQKDGGYETALSREMAEMRTVPSAPHSKNAVVHKHIMHGGDDKKKKSLFQGSADIIKGDSEGEQVDIDTSSVATEQQCIGKNNKAYALNKVKLKAVSLTKIRDYV
jgi:hypothetical protein